MRKVLLALTLALGAGLVMAPTGAHGAESQTLEGVLRLRIADPVVGGDAHDEQLILVTETSAFVLTGVTGEPNTRVRVTGAVSDGTFRADSLQSLGPAGDAVPPTGTTRVLIMLGHWNVPDDVTPDEAEEQFFDDSNGWYRDASYGALGQVGEATPWMEIDGPAGGRCYGDSASTMRQAKDAAVRLGYDLADYDNYVLYSPNNAWQEGSDCDGFAGWAHLGAPDMWLNGYLDRRVIVHEQGHNYGLSHSHSYLCTEVIVGSCTWSDYGDDFDAMGASNLVGHFSAPQKDLLGWMTGRQIDLSAGGRATLAPLARDPVAVSAVRIQASPSRSYWLEFRQRIDHDSSLPVAATNGVLLHARDTDISGDNGSNLLDTRPGDGLSVHTATMRPGRVWRTPEGFTIAEGAVTSEGATVIVTPPVCVDAELEPDDTRGQARPVRLPTTQSRAFCAAEDEDWVTFAGREGQEIRMESRNLAPDTDTYFVLYDSDGRRLKTSDDVGGTSASRIDYTPPADGTLYLRVRQYDGLGSANRTYDLRIARR